MTIAAAYVRVSKEEQAEKDLSIPAQKARIIAYCQSQNWDIYDFYVDDGYSAKNLNRPDMNRLLRDCSAGKFSVVVVVRLDRISRSQKDVLYLIEDIFEPNGIGFKSVTQSFDTTSAFGKAAIGMIAVFAQLERDQLIERVTDAKKEAAKQGRFGGGSPPYGYTHCPATKSVEINEIEAKIVRLIYQEYANGYSYQYIAEKLNTLRVPTRNPKKKATPPIWDRSTVHKILKNPFYRGCIEHKGVLYKGQHPVIINEEQQEQVLALSKNRNRFLPQTEAGLISGMVFCGECGARMRTKNVWQNYPKTNPKHVIRYYICYSQDGGNLHLVKNPACRCGYKQASMVDNQVVSYLERYASSPVLIKQVAKELLDKANNPGNTRAIAQAKKDLDITKKKLSRWYDAFEQGALAPDELTDRVRDLREQRQFLEQQLIEYEEIEANKQVNIRTVEEFVVMLKSFKKVWREATPEERKAVLYNLVKKVQVYQDNRVEVTLIPE